MEINEIPIHWSALFKKIGGLKTDVENWIIIEREIVPIIFIPGFMGSRLRKKGDKTRVWDPDYTKFMLKK
ncbi:MAG: hypothetical protein WAO55_11720, partial [Candidatus Manganitrophaceae bacterium]